MVNLILFVLATIGLTNILIFGKIFSPVREWLTNNAPDYVNELFACYQCMGTWAGAFCGAILLDHSIFGILMCAFAGSYISHTSALIHEWIEANSLVSLDPEEDYFGESHQDA